jgi:hypothetical protein
MFMRQDDHNREVAKLYFEYFKHFTTVSTAVALVELVLYQAFALTLKTLIAGVDTLTLTLLLSIAGMIGVLLNAENGFQRIGGILTGLMGGIALSFFSGLLMFGVLFAYTTP